MEDLRLFPVGNYIVYYAPLEDGIRIGHISHGMMDQMELFRRWILSDDFKRQDPGL